MDTVVFPSNLDVLSTAYANAYFLALLVAIAVTVTIHILHFKTLNKKQ